METNNQNHTQTVPRSEERRVECRNAQHVHQMLKKGEVFISKVLEMIKMSVQRIKVGIPTYLN